MVQKLSKDIFKELAQLDSRLKKLATVNEQLPGVNHSGVLQGSVVDQSVKAEIKDIRTTLEHLYSTLHGKANIQDVCALVDAKANQEDLKQAVNELAQLLHDNYLRRDLWEEWKQCFSQQREHNPIQGLQSALLNMSQLDPNPNRAYNSVLVS